MGRAHLHLGVHLAVPFNTPYGFFDQALGSLGIDGPAWLGDPFWARVAVIAANVWLGVPFFMVALLGGLQSIDRNLLDAASADGASPVRRFCDITLPGLRPVAATVVLLGAIWTFNAFNLIFLMTGGGPAGSTDILVTFAYQFGFDSRLYGVAAAYGVIILSLLLAFGGLYRSFIRRLGEGTWAWKSRRPRSRFASVGLHGMLLGAVVIALFPFLWLLTSSFKRAEDINSPELQLLPERATLDNYEHVLTGKGGEFLQWLTNSAVIALLTTVAALFLAATAAYAFSRYRFPGYRPALTSFLITQMFPGAILVVPIFNIIVHLGLLNSKLGLVLAYATVAVPFSVWMLKGYFDTIPISIEEAGRVDGLTPFGTFWRIVVPLSLPGLAVTGFFSFMTSWNEVLFANVLLVDQSSYTLPLGLRTYVNQFEIHYELLSAGAVLVTIPAVLVFLLAQRYFVAGLTRGGVKA